MFSVCTHIWNFFLKILILDLPEKILLYALFIDFCLLEITQTSHPCVRCLLRIFIKKKKTIPPSSHLRPTQRWLELSCCSHHVQLPVKRPFLLVVQPHPMNVNNWFAKFKTFDARMESPKEAMEFCGPVWAGRVFPSRSLSSFLWKMGKNMLKKLRRKKNKTIFTIPLL